MIIEYYYGILQMGEYEFLGHEEGQMSKFGADVPNGYDMNMSRFVESIAEYNFLDQLWQDEDVKWPLVFRLWDMNGEKVGDWAVAMFWNERTHERLFGTDNQARKDWHMGMEDGPKFVAKSIDVDELLKTKENEQSSHNQNST